MSYENSVKYNRVRSMRGLPIGAIIPWASDSSSIPSGWIICDGTVYPDKQYPLLYDIIGNTYGGTAGSTFKTPPLNSSSASVVDMYPGHYGFLKTRGEAHAPQTASISVDPFWSIVGKGNNQDSGSNSQTSWISTIDLVGQFVSRPNLFGLYDEITLSQGSYSYTVSYTEAKLPENNLVSHVHSLSDGTSEVPWKRKSGTSARDCNSSGQEAQCRLSCDSSKVVTRVVAPSDGGEFFANRQSDLDACFLANRLGFVGTGGGGDTVTTTAGGQTSAKVYRGGDGRSSGNMRGAASSKVWFTSLSNSETSLDAVSPHTHGANTYNLQGRLNLISPGIRNDISMNTVQIDNSPGQNFGTITANTATPQLEVLYIIRAY